MHLQVNDALLISPIGRRDKAAFLEHLKDREIADRTLSIPFPYTETDADAWIDHNLREAEKFGRNSTWAIRRSKDEFLVGGIGFLNHQPGSSHTAELGYWVAKPYWNQGIATAAVRAITEFGFHEMALERVTAHVFSSNTASSKVLEKCGFKAEGYLRNHYKKHDRLLDAKLYAVLRSEWNHSQQGIRPDFIRHYSEIQEKDNAHYNNSDELLSIGSPFARRFGLQKLGIHHEILPPGRRTSWPHAESDEEEFVYVISGHPDAWINGELFRLNPGDGVGFPAGTGILHTFINNTDNEVRLLVVGEATKKENKCIYALHPERNEEIRRLNFLWENPPHHPQGPHDGLPDQLRRKNGL